MSRFTEFLEKSLKEDTDVAAVPSQPDNARFGNVGRKSSMLSHTPQTSDEIQENKFKKIIDDNDISIDEDTVKNIVAVVDKTLNDWNREKKLDSKEIETVISKAIESGLIHVK